MQNWLVIRTRPRWEKKVAKLLLEKGVETFCPLVSERRQWSDRVKTIDTPLLRSYLFVRISEEQRTTVRLTEGVVNFIYKSGKPVVVKEKQIQHIRRFQQMHPRVHALESASEESKGCKTLASTNGEGKAAILWIETLNILLVAAAEQPVFIKATNDRL